MAEEKKKYSLSTTLLHGDANIPITSNDVIPPISVTTTYRASENPVEAKFSYSRVDHPVRQRCEEIIGTLENGHAVLYGTGLSAAYAAIGYLRPNRILIQAGGYHGVQEVIKLTHKRTGVQVLPLSNEIAKGDLVWLESPRNPDCRLQDIQAYSQKAHAVGATVVVDATFAPPPVQYTLALGADIVMHSTTKFYGGHSDLLGGALIVRTKEQQEELQFERLVMGNVPGNLETWLLLRSLKTFELRIRQQCETSNRLAAWFESDENKHIIKRVWHLSRTSHPDHQLAVSQMKMFGSVMSIELKTEAIAQKLPTLLKLVANATSLGGVESLIEWRHKYDSSISKELLRFSVGLESFEDLVDDFRRAFVILAKESKESKL